MASAFHSAHQHSNLVPLKFATPCLTTPCLTVASKCLEQFTSGCNLTIHNVPGDGNCLFWSVSYQLNAKTMCSTSAPELRQMVASYMENHSDHFSSFLAGSQPSSNPYDNDTEAPTIEDSFIDSIADPNLQLLARW